MADDRGAEVPDLARVLRDRAVRRKLTDAGDVQQRLLQPRRAVAVDDVDTLLRIADALDCELLVQLQPRKERAGD
jgi:hypothetical protein